jgi:hypothetical protein
MLRSGLKWTNCSEELPEDMEEVIIRTRDEFRLAVYKRRENCFFLSDGSKVGAGKKHPQPMAIGWMRLMKPQEDLESQALRIKKAG